MGNGGVIVRNTVYTEKFQSDLSKLSKEIKDSVKEALKALLQESRPPWIRFEKLSGHKNPSIYTIHATKNHSHKISFELNGDVAKLRRIGTHKEIDRTP